MLNELAEQRIQDAMARGELDDLPGAGRPLNLDDDSRIPPELRMPYRVLRNANCLPPEIERRREIRDLEDLLDAAECGSPHDLAAARRRLRLLRLQVSEKRGASPLWADPLYRETLVSRLDRRHRRA